MRPLALTVTLISLFYSLPALACSCSASPFLELAELQADSLVLQVRVSSHSDRTVRGPSYLDGEVIRQFKGEEVTGSLRIYGDGGMSCMPYAYRYSIGEEWLLIANRFNGQLYLGSCQPQISVRDETASGLITPLSCSDYATNVRPCWALTPEELAEASAEEMSLDEFDRVLRLYASAVSLAVRACTGPWGRCKDTRPSYDAETGLLTLPSLDVVTDPELYGTYGISATLEADDPEAPESFRVIDFGGPRGLIHLD